MVRYELKKALDSRGGKVALALYLALVILMCWLSVGSVTWVDDQGGHIKGPAAAQKLRQAQSQWEGFVDQELLNRVLQENQRIESTPQAQSQDVTQRDIAFGWKQGFAPIREMISDSYRDSFRDYDYYTADRLTEIDEQTFYGNRIRLLEQWLYDETDSAFTRFSEEEKQYILEQYRQFQSPVYFEYHEGWYWLLHNTSWLSCEVLILSFLLAGLFTNERKWKAEAVYLSTPLGRKMATAAKVKAGIALITLLYWAAILVYSLVTLGCLGAQGGGCMIQVRSWQCMYNLSIAQVWVIQVVCGYLGQLFLGLLVMYTAARFDSAPLAVSVPFLLYFLPGFLEGQADWLDGLLELGPMTLTDGYSQIRSFDLVTVFGKVFPPLQLCVPVYLALSLVLIPAIGAGFRRKQIG